MVNGSAGCKVKKVNAQPSGKLRAKDQTSALATKLKRCLMPSLLLVTHYSCARQKISKISKKQQKLAATAACTRRES